MSVDQLPPSRTSRLVRVSGLVAVIAFVALLVYGIVKQAPDTTIDDALAQNRPVAPPGFDLSVLESGQPGPLATVWERAAQDGRVNLDELRGTPVVINFWASWCDPCRQEARLLQRGWEAARERGVLFVGLDMQDVREDARDFLRQFEQDYPQVRDPTKDTARAWGATGIPETFFISRRGDVVAHVIGALTEQQLKTGVDASLSGKPIGAQFGGEQRPTQ